MKRLLRWGGLAISISTYVALTIWTNTSAGRTAISRGESAARAAMQPFWWLIYIGVGMFFASWILPRRRPDHHGSGEKKQPVKDSQQSSTISTSQSDRPHTAPSPEEMQRAVQHLKAEILSGNLRPRRSSPDPAEENPEE